MARMRKKFADRNEGIMNPNIRGSTNYNYSPGKSTAAYFGRSPLEELGGQFSSGRDQISKSHMNRTGQNLSNYNSNYNYLPGKSTAAYFGRSPLEELEGRFSSGRDEISKRRTAGKRGWTPTPNTPLGAVDRTARPNLFPEQYEHMVGENRGIMNTLPANNLMAELGLPATMDWQTNPYENLTLDELIGLGASEEQIAAYLGLA